MKQNKLCNNNIYILSNQKYSLQLKNKHYAL